MTFSPRSSTRLVVVLEGPSDVAAIRELMKVCEIEGEGVELVPLHGVTKIGRFLSELRLVHGDLDVVGMCDAGEAQHVQKALAEDGLPVTDVTDLPAYGFFVCEADLEDELIRALGPDKAKQALEGAGLGGKLDALRQQAAWADRPLAEQLHRFCGSTSGRKELAAGVLARDLDADTVPEPIGMLLDRIRWA